MGDRVTADQAAELLGITRSRIDMWKNRGKVTPIDFIRGRGRGGVVPIYDLDDLRRRLDGGSTTSPRQ